MDWSVEIPLTFRELNSFGANASSLSSVALVVASIVAIPASLTWLLTVERTVVTPTLYVAALWIPAELILVLVIFVAVSVGKVPTEVREEFTTPEPNVVELRTGVPLIS